MRGSGIALTATPMPGWKFDSWAVGSSEECHNWRATTQSPQCTTTINDALDITAYFVLDNPLYDNKTLNVWISGGPTGGGKVTGGGISCGEYICMKTYDYGTSITLTAEPNQGYKFDGWKDYSDTDRSICSGT